MEPEPPSSRPSRPSREPAVAAPRTCRLEIASRSETGEVRAHNEDVAFVVRPAEECDVFGVCDGMGGASAGEVASSEAAKAVAEHLSTEVYLDWGDALAGALQHAAERVHAMSRRNRSLEGMGTTATVAAVVGNELVVGQVGDSRAYLLRQGRLRQLTRDQTLVQLMIDKGQLRPEEARGAPFGNVILQSVGTSTELDVAITREVLHDRDVVLVCSDGLTGALEDRDIERILLETSNPRAACVALVDAALEAGATDNVTCVVARVSAPSLWSALKSLLGQR